MRTRTLRAWAFVHTWTSLAASVFLLMLCVTGLPLIFHDEIERLADPSPPLRAVPPGTPPPALQDLAARALEAGGHTHVNFVLFDEHAPVVEIGTSSAADPPPGTTQTHRFDRRSGEALPAAPPDDGFGFMALMLRLHTDLFAGLPGTLFLGAMGLLLIAALVSGTVLYAPFMRKLHFGEVRPKRKERAHWLDLHNLTGIVTLVWLAVVGLTGAISTLEMPVSQLWRGGSLAQLRQAAVQAGGDAAPARAPASPDAVLAAARAALPGTEPASVIYPGLPVAGPSHFMVVVRGDRPATRQLVHVALVDAASGEVAARSAMPWYVQVLSLSQPLHFGDYGGLPLKILWALLDGLSIVVLASGLVLWWRRRRPRTNAGRPPYTQTEGRRH